MDNKSGLVNYVRSHRKHAGLSQRELATILGYCDEGVVSRHELFLSVPPLLIALGYEVIFQTSISDLFPGLKQTIESAIEKNLTDFESKLIEKVASAPQSQSGLLNHKMQWLNARRKTMSASRTP